MNYKLIAFAFLLALFVACVENPETVEDQSPNIVLIMADDMGYGDLQCYNSESKILTPNIDNLAANGMRFTDAHAPGTTCTPSRYGLLTGRYPFRNKRSYKQGLIQPGQLTIAGLLQKAGYTTACIGKWHQGIINEKNPMPGVELMGNPTQHGFEYFFGLPASLDIPPYYYIENGQCVNPPSDTIGANNTPGISPIQGAFWRKGGVAPGYKHENVLDELKDKACDYIGAHFQNRKTPLFLYFPLPAPHTPWLPNQENKGKTSIGDYGDYTAQVDDVVGQVMQKLKEAGQDKNTMVIFTSDNGPVWYPEDVEKYSHSSTGPLAGMKGDLWEGGHRMPFVMNWAGVIKPKTVNDHLTCFTDFMATFAELTQQQLSENAGEDSYSFLSQLNGKESKLPERKSFVIGRRNRFAISTGEWKYINIPGPGGFSERYLRDKEVKFEFPEQLYHIKTDMGEKENLSDKNQEKVNELKAMLTEIVGENESHSFDLQLEQITSGTKHHFFGYIGQCQTIPWNASNRYILGLEIERIDRMPKPEEAASILLIDTQNDNKIIYLDKTHAWNPQQGTMFYWNPQAPETQFFFNDRDIKTGKVFTAVYDIEKKERVREYRFEDTPIGNGGVAANGSAWLGINYGRLARLRLVTGYPEALDWSKDEIAPTNDGIFVVDIKSGEKRLLVSYAQLDEKLREANPGLQHDGLFINHTLWNRDADRVYFYARAHWNGQSAKRVNQPFSINIDGTGLTPHETFIGGHPEWAEGNLVIGVNKAGGDEDLQVLYNVDTKQLVGHLGNSEIFPKPGADVSLSPDGNWFVNGYSQSGKNYYAVYRRSDGAFVRSEGIDKGEYSGDIRIDPAPRWNRTNDAILVPGIDKNGTRQIFMLRVNKK